MSTVDIGTVGCSNKRRTSTIASESSILTDKVKFSKFLLVGLTSTNEPPVTLLPKFLGLKLSISKSLFEPLSFEFWFVIKFKYAYKPEERAITAISAKTISFFLLNT